MLAPLRTTSASLVALIVVACGSARPSGGADGSSSSADTGATSSTGTSTTTTDTGGMTEPLGEGHGCCELHDAIGCDEADVQACVCDDSPVCCAFRWDALCVDLAHACDATCMPDGDATADEGPGDGSVGSSSGDPPPPGDGPCCEAAASGTGCDDAEVSACTCDLDPYCCDVAWDEYCVAIASQSCAIDCANECCRPHGTVACNDVEVFGCVVEQIDACFDAWGADCVDAAIGDCGLRCA